MKIGEIAQKLGIDKGTVYNWTDRDEFVDLFTPEARKAAGNSHRVYSDADVAVLTTIHALRNQEGINDWGEIEQVLRSGQRITDIPVNRIASDPRVVSVSQAEQSARAAATLAERDAALARVQELEDQLDGIRDGHREEIERLKIEYKEALNDERDRADKLHDQISKLNREIGRLEGELARLRSDEE